MTDNAKNYVIARDFQIVLAGRGVRHARMRPYRPQTNGTVERIHLTLAREWAPVTGYATEAEDLAALPTFVDWCNTGRSHTALDGRPAMSSVIEFPGHDKSGRFRHRLHPRFE